MMESAIWSMGDKKFTTTHKIKIVLYINYQIVSSGDYNINIKQLHRYVHVIVMFALYTHTFIQDWLSITSGSEEHKRAQAKLKLIASCGTYNYARDKIRGIPLPFYARDKIRGIPLPFLLEECFVCALSSFVALLKDSVNAVYVSLVSTFH